VPADIPEIVKLHLASFPGFFLTNLGPQFLTLMYISILHDPQGLSLAIGGEGLRGFVVGVEDQEAFYCKMKSEKKWQFAWVAIGTVLKHPKLAFRAIRALRLPKEARQSSARACLMSIAVDPLAQGQGVGKQLVTAFWQEMRERGVPAFCLTTDRDHNKATNDFYQNLGFRLVREYRTPEGRWMNEYLMDLDFPAGVSKQCKQSDLV
jgi:ribosomal protein S18 acetylase RimI-like enzyme